MDKASQGHRESFSQVALSSAWQEEEFLGIEAFWVVDRKKQHDCGTCRLSQCSQPSCTFKLLGSKILLGVDWHIHKSVQGVSEQLEELPLSEHTKYNQPLEGLSRGSYSVNLPRDFPVLGTFELDNHSGPSSPNLSLCIFS